MGNCTMSSSADITTVHATLKRNFDAIEAVLNTLQNAVACDCTGVSWFEPGEDNVRIMPCGLPELSRYETTPAMPGRTVCCYPLETRRPLAITRFADEVPDGFTKCNFMVAEGLSSYLAHPVTGAGPNFRMLVCAMSRHERPWSEGDIDHARRAALALTFILAPTPTPARH